MARSAGGSSTLDRESARARVIVARPAKILAVIAAIAGLLLSEAKGRSAANEEEGREVNLAVGGQKVLPSAGVVNYSEPSGIVQIKTTEDGRRMVISAVRTGSTTIVLIYSNGKQETIAVNVYPRSPQAVRAELKTLLAGIAGIEIREVSGRIFLDGAVPSQDDLARIERIVAAYPGQVTSLVTVDPARQRTNIKLDFHFVQFRKIRSHKLGVSWPSSFGAHVGAGGQPSTSFLFTYDFLLHAVTQGQLVVAENLLPSLDLLGIRGWAKIRNVVSVITTNGGTAVYHTGGEVNVKISTALGQSSLQKIPFGVQLTVQTRLDPASGLVVVTIDAEQSQLTPIQGQDVPGRVLTQTRTNVHVRVGQSIMLSGFKESTEALNAHGIPLLMRIPLLGYLFRSEDGDSSETENILFITPTVIENSSPANMQRIEDALKRYHDYGGVVVY